MRHFAPGGKLALVPLPYLISMQVVCCLTALFQPAKLVSSQQFENTIAGGEQGKEELRGRGTALACAFRKGKQNEQVIYFCSLLLGLNHASRSAIPRKAGCPPALLS